MTGSAHRQKWLLILLILPLLFACLTYRSSAMEEDPTLPALKQTQEQSPPEEEQRSSSKTTTNTTHSSELIPSGQAFGVKMYTKGVMVVGITQVYGENGVSRSPAKDCGIEVGDTILSIDGADVATIAQVTKLIEQSTGKSLHIVALRGKAKMEFDLTPIRCASDGVYRAGFWVKDTTCGIGTVTFIDPETGYFAGLGHGICDAQSGNLIPYLGGDIYDVTISGAIPGKVGQPGELKGYFNQTKTGTLLDNTAAGVSGIFGSIPDTDQTPIPVAKLSEVKTGKATIRCTLDQGEVKEYEIRIDSISRDNGNLKNFKITVTDPDLLAITGGIVQGMSGSPIIQNGKLIGAVTHVLVNDPTKGYGIYIGNMLAETR